MNTRTLTALIAIAAVASAFALPAMAQEATPEAPVAITSTASREAVRADAIAALKAGLIERGEASRSFTAFESTLSRTQVAAEGREALRLGLVAFGEGPAATATPAQAEAIRTAGQKAIGQTVAQAVR